MKLKYQTEEVVTDPLGSNSIAVASLTTAYARVRLYRALKKIRPDRLLYAGNFLPTPSYLSPNHSPSDTDSIIFVHDTREPNPLAEMMGETLGRMTDELPAGSRCIGFVSQGPKVSAS